MNTVRGHHAPGLFYSCPVKFLFPPLEVQVQILMWWRTCHGLLWQVFLTISVGVIRLPSRSQGLMSWFHLHGIGLQLGGVILMRWFLVRQLAHSCRVLDVFICEKCHTRFHNWYRGCGGKLFYVMKKFCSCVDCWRGRELSCL